MRRLTCGLLRGFLTRLFGWIRGATDEEYFAAKPLRVFAAERSDLVDQLLCTQWSFWMWRIDNH